MTAPAIKQDRAPVVAAARLGKGVRVVTVKLPPHLVIALDAIGERWSTNRSEVIRVLIERENERISAG